MKTPRRPRKLWRWAFAAGLGVIVLFAGAIWGTHRHLTQLTVAAVNRAFPALELSARTVAFSPRGVLDLRAIRWRVRATGAEALHIPSAQVRFTWPGLRRHFIREIFIEQPRLHVSAALLAAFHGEHAGSGTAGEAWQVGRLTVRGGFARVELMGQPSMRGRFAVDLAEDNSVENHLAFNALQVRAPGDTVDAIALASARIVASPADLRAGRLRQVVVDAPVLQLTDRAFAWILEPRPTSPDRRGWTCDRLSIRRGTARMHIAAWPQIVSEFALEAEHVAAEGGGAYELSLAAMRARLQGEEADVFSIASLRLGGTLAGLARGEVHALAIENPQVHVTDRVLAWQPPAAVAPHATTSPSPRWKIGRLNIERGKAQLDLAGAPLAEFAFGARWQNAGPGGDGAEVQAVEVRDFAMRTRGAGVEPFLRVPSIRIELRLPELLEQRRLARIRVEHLDFRYHAAFREMIARGAAPAPIRGPGERKESGPPTTIGELRISDGRLHFDDLGLGIPGIECRLETVFRELALTAGGGAGGREVQTIELSQLALRSPLDPFFTVLDLESVFVRFTLADLWRRQIEEVAIVRPTLAVGPDLFWYIDRVQQNQGDPTAPPAIADDGPPWSIQNFSAEAGQLVLALEGQAQLALPMPFESHAQNLNFRRLSELRLKLQIDMPEQDYDYPGYELALRGVAGRIEFSLPPAQGSNNVVNTLRLRAVQWKNFRGREVFLDVTYDERGIYGNLTGKGYGGIVRGQFNFLLTPAADWNAWVSGTHLALGPITDALAPEKFLLTGPADFRLTVAARAKEILSVKGDFDSRGAGRMKIGKLDELIRELPGDWSGVKRGLSRISLETLRDFAYESAHGDFDFRGLAGAVRLDLRGPLGMRRIDMKFHDEPQAVLERVAAAP